MASGSLFLDLVLGGALLAIIGLAATRSRLTAQAPDPRLGWALVAAPLPLVVTARVSLPSSPLAGQAAFVCAVVAFAAGALLILSSRDDADEPGGDIDVDPAPWWPDFERDFRAYDRRQSRPRARV